MPPEDMPLKLFTISTLWHGTNDEVLSYNNLGEAVKQWTNTVRSKPGTATLSLYTSDGRMIFALPGKYSTERPCALKTKDSQTGQKQCQPATGNAPKVI